MSTMPDVGTSASSPGGSHTATAQWQSFELRMRRRRAERCVRNAQEALETGRIQDARDAIEEARRLGISADELATVEEQLERPAAAPPVRPLPPRVAPTLQPVPQSTAPDPGSLAVHGSDATALAAEVPLTHASLEEPVDGRVHDASPPAAGRPRSRRIWRGLATAAALAVAAGGVLLGTSWNLEDRPNTPGPLVVVGEPRPDISLPAPERRDRISVQEEQIEVPVAIAPDPPSSTAADASSAPRPAATAPQYAAAPAEPPPIRTAAPPPETLRAVTDTPASPPVVPASLTSLPIAATLPVAEPPAAPLAAQPGAAAGAAPAMGGAAGNTERAAAKPEDSSPVGTAGTAPAPPAIDEATRVRAVLARYASAYSALDASAARAVWPTVDERALARAFNGLASQNLSLGRCEVSLLGTTARAECAGTATWSPRVGGGERTQPRRWSFELRNTGSNWSIVRADAR